MQHYYAEFRDKEGHCSYGWTFRDRNISRAKLLCTEDVGPALDACLVKVWRVNRESYQRLEKYRMPRMILNEEDYNEAQ